jgi:hypothetical protein
LDSGFFATLIGIVAGALGYWFVTFSMQPILRYRDVRAKILMDFTYYAQVVNANGLSDEMQKLFVERVRENRKSSAQLQAAVCELPFWYSWYLGLRGLKPAEASRQLIGFSNTTNWTDAPPLENTIRRALGLPQAK